MDKKLYLECYAGISGDMTVAALLDLGADADVLKKALESLPIDGFETRISRVKKAGIDACDFNVILEHENHDHDMEYLHGHKHEHEHHHDHDHEHHHHEHRGLEEIKNILLSSSMTDHAKATAVRIFEIIADAEAKAHGLPRNEVHFHEVGAVDSIVDIAAVAVCLDNLGIDEVIVPVLYEGRGTVRCQHGILPIPVPAVANIADAHHLPLHLTDTQGEFVTPTGAAIVAAVCTGNKLPQNFTVLKTGIGAGKRTYERPSILRAMIIEEAAKTVGDEIIKLECNIDDCSGEVLGFVMSKLMNAGARDVHYFPVFMKKNRPAYQLNVICKEEQRESLQNIIFEETTTIGIRILRMERAVLPREIKQITTSLGEVHVKVCTLPSGKQRCYPEYEDIAALSTKLNKPFLEVFNTVYTESNKA
ncbi:MAG: nickel pincer cofactor biosynthesis protein LarC [Bacteroidales bacterium]|nr:nickel pincer cofactor biosynthesis protein LarC [Bacteroidales bacterium]